MKKFICLALFLLVLTVSAFAADISTADELLTLMNTESMWADDYTLTANIDLSTATNGLSQKPIGSANTPYSGTFDGNGYEISNINLSGNQYVALFGYVNGGTIKNLTVSGSVTASSYYSGGLVAYAKEAINISRCHNKCNVTGIEYTGGICGYAYGSDKSTTTPKMNITECMNSGTITCLDTVQSDAGGIAGSIYAVGNVSDCLNIGLVTTGDISLDKPYIGGICGKTGSYGKVTNCYNTVAPETPSEVTTYVRAIVGRPNVKNGLNNFFKDGLGMSDKNYGSVYSEASFDALNANGLWVNAEDPFLAYFYVAPEGPDVPDVPDEPEVPEVTLDSNIETADELLTLMNYPSLWNADYTLAADIDLSTATNRLSQMPIGSAETPYSGTFDGAGHAISGINISGDQYVALFGYVNNATIKNLTVSGTITASSYYSGGIIAYAGADAVTVERCHNKCNVTGIEYIGGIIGYFKGTDTVNTAEPKSVISECKNSGTITCLDTVQSDAGGIVGSAWNIGGIRNCLNTGLVTTGDVSPSKAYVGGICGKTYSYVQIDNCYNAVSPTTASESKGYVRGIVGYPAAKNASNCYYKDGLGMSDLACGSAYSQAEFSLLNVYGAWVDKNEPKLAAFYECDHADVRYETITASTCEKNGSANKVCEICFEDLGTIELPLDENEHTSYQWERGVYACNGCGESFENLESTYLASPLFVVTGEGKITITVNIFASEPVLAAGFEVKAPTGTTLVNVVSDTDSEFAFVGATEYANPYRMSVISNTGIADTVDMTVTLTYAVENVTNSDEFNFEICELEAYDEKGAVAFTTANAAVTYAESIVGDVDGDGSVSVIDVMLVLNAVTNGKKIVNSDMNGDGSLSLIDVLQLLKKTVQ
ncbi:MAG: hypothetical protein IJA60_00610 [Clostridia bacterium]|nr:hypothetical protein [Clostridia bacterium]